MKVGLMGLVLATALAASQRAQIKALPERWQRWLEEEVYPLITDQQKKAFLQLTTDAQREEFANRLWQLWGEQVGLGASFRRIYEERLQTCREEFGNTTEDRARILLLHGPPAARLPVDCQEVFYPLEFWRYAYVPGLGQGVTVLFYKPYGLGRFRLWDPFETRWVLYTPNAQAALRRPSMTRLDRPEYRCGNVDELLNLLASAEYWLSDPGVRQRLEHLVVESPSAGKESVEQRFLAFSTLLPKDAEPLEFYPRVEVVGRRGSKALVRLACDLPASGFSTATVGERAVIQLDVVGELARQGEMADRFRYAFTFPAESQTLSLVVERELRPGDYVLRLKVADAHGKRAGVQELPVSVGLPAQPEPPSAPAPGQPQEERLLLLVGPQGEGLAGVQRFTALAQPSIAKVEFLLDGKSVLTKNRPPFEVELDLGPLPRLATVTAVGYDVREREVDRAEVVLNVGRERFFVRLSPITKADQRPEGLSVSASVNVPSDRKLERLELYYEDRLLASLFGPPFSAVLPVRLGRELAYVRALAVLDDGSQAEDVQLVNAPQFVTAVRVQAVELPVLVLDRAGKPVEGLSREDFEVLEEGVPQELLHFAREQDLPMRVGLVIDTSGSMQPTLPEVQRVVLGFVKHLLRPKDRAFLIAFSDRPVLLSPFTADVGALERALLTLRAERETSLWDAVIYGVFQFSGVRGRKALVVLTDGEDTASRAPFERALDFAQRSGVTVYTIAIGLPLTKVKPRSQLTRLAKATGGEAFFLGPKPTLEPVYGQIERELRSQYLLAYSSATDAPPGTFRSVTVKVKKPGLTVRTAAGYFVE
ncbi:MAG: VWA domain-containing protein [Thermoanaerobaculum sp.]|nr:VWA domain-containing protein [Thermoanaerobaculum sp.]MDW7967858.1 VWA domain-containing protein [Thermoanaerobaculum sp.]